MLHTTLLTAKSLHSDTEKSALYALPQNQAADSDTSGSAMYARNPSQGESSDTASIALYNWRCNKHGHKRLSGQVWTAIRLKNCFGINSMQEGC